uniref:Uncharacterized protein n=1 Tax=Sciurus vulgaris TaxID=55149 RepID=A0A8D2CVZ0_SCIVU
MLRSSDSPENTPPPTPTAPSSGSRHSGRTTSGPLGSGSAAQASTKTKQRKRGKSAAAWGVRLTAMPSSPATSEGPFHAVPLDWPLSPIIISFSLTDCPGQKCDGFSSLLM